MRFEGKEVDIQQGQWLVKGVYFELKCENTTQNWRKMMKLGGYEYVENQELGNTGKMSEKVVMFYL